VKNHYFSDDTICAIATSLAGDAGVGIIRISGKNALKCASILVKGLDSSKPRYASRIYVYSLDGKLLDDGIGIYFKENESFTGEEIVELQVHGGRFLLQLILSEILKTKFCRLALPGEFMFRAVQNGKVSIHKAQALNQLITSKSTQEILNSRQLLSEKKIEAFEKIKNLTKELLAKIELSIDFSDQDVEVISLDEFKSKLLEVENLIYSIELKMKNAKKIHQGIKVGLIGKPNAGKSTLFNSLLSENRAIVSDIAGTTRDIISEEILMDKYFVRLSDTAGLRDSSEIIESEGIKRSLKIIDDSDFLVLVLNVEDSDEEILIQIQNLKNHFDKLILAVNKIDLVDFERLEKLKTILQLFNLSLVFCSGLKDDGINDLVRCIVNKIDDKIGLNSDMILPNEFQLESLTLCKEVVLKIKNLITYNELKFPELLSVELQALLNSISNLVGETTPDDILTKIFSEFCIGK
jgi:tRNA modification GTPase